MNKRYQEELIDVLIKSAKNRENFKALVEDLLTPAEYSEIVTRLQIVKRLAKGEPQRAIARDLKIGIATVTRGSRELANPNGGFAKIVNKLK